MEKKLLQAGLIVLAVLFMGSGCSFVFMKEPPMNHTAGGEIECSESVGAPVADTIFAVTAGILSAATFVSASNPDPDAWLDFTEIEMGAASIMLITSLVYGTSAIYGYVNADKCKRAKTKYEAVMSPVPGI